MARFWLPSLLHNFICPACCSVPSRPGSSRRASQPKSDKLPLRQPMAARDQGRWLSGYRLSFLPARSGVRRGPATLSGAPKAERKAAPKHIINVIYPGLCSIEQHIRGERFFNNPSSEQSRVDPNLSQEGPKFLL